MDFVKALQKNLPKLSIIAEDLGLLTPEVLTLRDNSGYPGMKVLGFAFNSREPSDYLPHRYTENAVCYTGTHDNMTTRQWFDTAEADAVAYATEYMALNETEGLVWGVIRTAMSSTARLCILPMQDLLELGEEARMNFPGTTGDFNWTWRVKNDMISEKLAQRLLKLTRLYERTSKNLRMEIEKHDL
jgi:4-alpha-glucanotransferase